LSLWECEDVDIDDLRALVIARNRHAEEEVDRDSSDIASNASGIHRSGDEVGKAQAAVGRAIKPLRKSRLQCHRSGFDRSTVSAASQPSTNVLSTIVAMGEASRPALVRFIRIVDCPSITQEEASTLTGLGVIDVVCSS
jgi:hypothetical protein